MTRTRTQAAQERRSVGGILSAWLLLLTQGRLGVGPVASFWPFVHSKPLFTNQFFLPHNREEKLILYLFSHGCGRSLCRERSRS